MSKHFITWLFLLLFINNSPAQTHIYITDRDDCLEHNIQILSNVLLQSKGQDFFYHMTNNGMQNFSVVCTLDSLGRMKEIVRIFSKSCVASDSTKQDILSYCKENDIRFMVCIHKEPGMTIKQIQDIITLEQRNSFILGMAWPGIKCRISYETYIKSGGGDVLYRLCFSVF